MIYVSYISMLTFGFHGGLFIKYAGKRRAEIEDTCKIIKRIGHEMTFLNIRESEMQRGVSLIDFILNEG